MVESQIDHKFSVLDRTLNKYSKSATIGGGTQQSRMLTPMRPICATIGSPSSSKQNKKTVSYNFYSKKISHTYRHNQTKKYYRHCLGNKIFSMVAKKI